MKIHRQFSLLCFVLRIKAQGRRLLLVGFSGVECGSSIKRNSILEMRKEFQMDLSLAKTPSMLNDSAS
jgi:hypothetical protein